MRAEECNKLLTHQGLQQGRIFRQRSVSDFEARGTYPSAFYLTSGPYISLTNRFSKITIKKAPKNNPGG